MSKKISQAKPVARLKDSDANRAIASIYDKLNEIISVINPPEKIIPKKEYEGNDGYFEVRLNQDGLYGLRIKTKDGWIKSTNTSVTGFTEEIENQ
jgi:hypothetical protein